ncbi:MAG TPA: Spy/CpxP family protein refolding chaperone [Telluria sp.]|jgi:Spy/CpxP family protein refolding chaperone
MNQHTDNSTPSTPRKSGIGRRWMLAVAMVAAVGAAGASTGFGGAGHGFGMHGGRGHHGPMDPESMAKHVDKLIERIAPDATAQQKARLAEITKAAFADLKPMHAEFRDAHKRLHALLMAPAIDRVALEKVRAEQMQRADVMSKRVLSAVEDAAEVLTPEQRLRFQKHLQGRMHR